MIGLARKSGKVSIGYDATCIDVAKNKTVLAMIAEDASEKTKKNVIFVCEKNNCKYIEYGEKDMLGKSLGKKMVSVLSINDDNMVAYILSNI
jgi:ribosomal protein L7Ae-like RNA K-turn-binding protein